MKTKHKRSKSITNNSTNIYIQIPTVMKCTSDSQSKSARAQEQSKLSKIKHKDMWKYFTFIGCLMPSSETNQRKHVDCVKQDLQHRHVKSEHCL